jgi:sugar lactone lactonase YvrE
MLASSPASTAVERALGLVPRLLLLAAAASLPGCTDDPPPCEAQPAHVCTLVGTGELGFNGDDRPVRTADLYLPSAARRGPDGRLYVMDFNNQRLRVEDDEGHLQTLIGSGVHAIAATGVPALETPLENPIDFRFDAAGRVVLVSYHDPRVLVLDDDGTLRSIAGQDDGEVGTLGNEGDGGPATAAAFMQLDGLAIAPDGAIYVSDSKAHRVRRIAPDGTIDTVAGSGVEGYAGDGGPGVDAALRWPSALELDGAGHLLVAETRNHVVRRLGPDGTIDTLAGDGTPGDAGDGGPARAARLDQPYGLALGPDGSLYVACRGSFRVRRIAPDGTIDTVAGTGEEGMRDGPARTARLGYLARLSIDDEGLVLADQSNAVIRRLTLP